MAEYGKQFFNRCLMAIVSELAHAEEQHPDWPDDPIHAAALVSKKAEELLLVSLNSSRGIAERRKQILKEATQTGAMALRLLLNMDGQFKQSYDMRTAEWWVYDQILS